MIFAPQALYGDCNRWYQVWIQELYLHRVCIKAPDRFFQISRVVDIESSSKSLRMGLVDRLTISAPKKMRTRPLDGSDLGHPVTTDISGEFGSEWAILDWL